MRQLLNLSKGTQVFLGRPKKPMDSSRSDALAGVVSSVDAILEAHIPQCFIPNVTLPEGEQVLIFVVRQNADPSKALNELGDRIKEKMPPGYDVLAIPMTPNDSLLQTVRQTSCSIFSRSSSESKWWAFWK